jgi:hypothetical protein
MRRSTRTLALGALAAAGLLLLAALAWRAAREGSPWDGRAPEPAAAAPATAPVAVPGGASSWELPDPTGQEAWEEAAETVALDLRGLVLGRPVVGAYEEARAEAARRDLALYPPDPARLRRLLLSASTSERVLALAALSTRGEASDDLVRIALRSARPYDDDVLRVLLADLVAALPPEQAARHEDDVLRVFEREPNPLVLAIALPALERLESPRLRALVEAQLGVAAPEMVPVLAGLARDRLGPEELRAVGISVFEAHGAGAGGGE